MPIAIRTVEHPRASAVSDFQLRLLHSLGRNLTVLCAPRRPSEEASYRRDKTRNPKLEIRNNVKCPKLKTQNAPAYNAVHFRNLEIRILNLFRISKFELRISKGKLDHFVNIVVTKK